MKKKENQPEKLFQPNDQTVIRIREVMELTGLPRSSVYRLGKTNPTFPKKVQLGEHSIGWVKQEIIDWASRIRK